MVVALKTIETMVVGIPWLPYDGKKGEGGLLGRHGSTMLRRCEYRRLHLRDLVDS